MAVVIFRGLLAGTLSMVSVGPSAAADGGCPIDPISVRERD
jgi:hypothetical protein